MTFPVKPLLGAAALALVITGAAAFMSPGPQASETLDSEQVRAIVKEYLEEHPEIVIEAIESYQERREEIEARTFKENFEEYREFLHADGLPYIGNPDGDVIIVEFFDYNCGFCKRALDDINKLVAKDDQIKVIFKEMPILSESSAEAARFAMAAHRQGQYFAYHQALMEFRGNKTTQALEKIGTDLGLDLEQLRRDAESTEVRREIERSLALSRRLGIRGTPAFIIGDVLAPGYMTHQAMQKLVDDVRDDQG